MVIQGKLAIIPNRSYRMRFAKQKRMADEFIIALNNTPSASGGARLVNNSPAFSREGNVVRTNEKKTCRSFQFIRVFIQSRATWMNSLKWPANRNANAKTRSRSLFTVKWKEWSRARPGPGQQLARLHQGQRNKLAVEVFSVAVHVEDDDDRFQDKLTVNSRPRLINMCPVIAVII